MGAERGPDTESVGSGDAHGGLATSVGYPPGARYTQVPDLFIARDVVEIADPVQLKVALLAIWRIHRRPRGGPAAVREEDLIADPAIRDGLRSLGVSEGDITSAVRGSLDALVVRGVLLCITTVGGALGTAADGGPTRWLALNAEEGRGLRERLQSGDELLPELPPAAIPAADQAPAHESIFALYEDNIGLVTPLLAESLREAAETYPPVWIEDAFREAVTNNARSWAYVRSILERWATDGRHANGRGSGSGARAGSRTGSGPGRDRDRGRGRGGAGDGRGSAERGVPARGRAGRGGSDEAGRRSDGSGGRGDRQDPYESWIKR